jgi:hypothetical protein
MYVKQQLTTFNIKVFLSSVPQASVKKWVQAGFKHNRATLAGDRGGANDRENIQMGNLYQLFVTFVKCDEENLKFPECFCHASLSVTFRRSSYHAVFLGSKMT